MDISSDRYCLDDNKSDPEIAVSKQRDVSSSLMPDAVEGPISSSGIGEVVFLNGGSGNLSNTKFVSQARAVSIACSNPTPRSHCGATPISTSSGSRSRGSLYLYEKKKSRCINVFNLKELGIFAHQNKN